MNFKISYILILNNIVILKAFYQMLIRMKSIDIYKMVIT